MKSANRQLEWTLAKSDAGMSSSERIYKPSEYRGHWNDHNNVHTFQVTCDTQVYKYITHLTPIGEVNQSKLTFCSCFLKGAPLFLRMFSWSLGENHSFLQNQIVQEILISENNEHQHANLAYVGLSFLPIIVRQ